MKKIMILLLAASLMSVSALSACSPKEDDPGSKEETELSSTAEPTEDEGELPFMSASESKEKNTSSAASLATDSSKTTGADSAGEQSASQSAASDPDGSKKTSDDAKENSSSKDKEDNSEKNSSESKKKSSSTSTKDNIKSSPTLSESASKYIEDNGDELPFIPAK